MYYFRKGTSKFSKRYCQRMKLKVRLFCIFIALVVCLLICCLKWIWDASNYTSELSEFTDVKQMRLLHHERVEIIGHTRVFRMFDCSVGTSKYPQHWLHLPLVPKDEFKVSTYHSWDYISHQIASLGHFEPMQMRLVSALMIADPGLQLVDIGSNLGVYSLLGVAHHRPVVAVEPVLPSLRRSAHTLLCSKAVTGSPRVRLVWNAICAQRGVVANLTVNPTNIGGTGFAPQRFGNHQRPIVLRVPCILMDDLVPLVTPFLVNFPRALVKMDMENAEHEALLYAAEFFHHIPVSVVVMEWSVKSYLPGRILSALFNFFASRDFQPFMLQDTSATLRLLDTRRNIEWPQDVIWIQRGQKDLVRRAGYVLL